MGKLSAFCLKLVGGVVTVAVFVFKGTLSGKNFSKRIHLMKNFQASSEKILAFRRKLDGRVVKTAFYVSRKTL